MFKTRRHLSYANVVATMALVFAMSGGALAARHYLISSTKQISPKVLKKLKGNAGAEGKTGSAGGQGVQGKEGPQGREGRQGEEGPQGKEGTTVVARVHAAGGITTSETEQADPLTGATWGQGASEADQFVGNAIVTAPPTSKCNVSGTHNPGELEFVVSLDGVEFAFGEVLTETAEQKAHVAPVSFFAQSGIAETGAAASHTLSAKMSDDCGVGGGEVSQHFVVEQVNIDILGAH